MTKFKDKISEFVLVIEYSVIGVCLEVGIWLLEFHL
jgi:hypothetical protein